MACDILDDMVNKAPPRGAHVTPSSAKEVSCMDKEFNAEQGYMDHGTIMFKEAFTISGAFAP